MSYYLEANNLHAGYGGVNILNGCHIHAKKGKIAVIVGANGAGKSTAMKAIFGLLPLDNGHIMLNGKDISHDPAHVRAAKGMGFVPQNNNIFPTMSVNENLDIGGYLRDDDIAQTKQEIYDLFPILYDKQDQDAGELSGGQRQQIAIARALMTKPNLLMLDEPTAGVSPIVMDEIFHNIVKIKQLDIAILMVEQNAKQALKIADDGFVLGGGQNLHTGTGDALLHDDNVRKSFLGG